MRFSKRFKFIPLAILTVPLFLSSCLKEALDDVKKVQNMNGIQSDIDIALPLVDMSFGIQDIYKNSSSLIRRENDQSFTFVYASKDSLPPTQYIKIPDIVNNFPLKVDTGIVTTFNALGSFTHAISDYAPLPLPNGAKLKQIFIKKGSFDFNITCDILHHTQLVFIYPTITKNGIPLRDTIDLNYTGTSPITLHKVTVLNDYVIDLTDNGISYNVLPFYIGLTLNKVPGNPRMAVGDQVNVVQAFKIDEYRGINGYVGRFLLDSINGENAISLFPNTFNVSLKLRDPKLKFRIASGFGIPVTMKIDSIYMINSDGQLFPINLFNSDTFSLPAPAAIGGYAVGDYSIDRSNSNLDAIINNSLQNSPKAVRYKLQLYANYNAVEVDNFMFDTSSLKIDVGMEVPMDLQVGNFNYGVYDTLTLPSDAALEIDEVGFYSLATNTLPLDLRVQYYFGRYNPTKDSSFEVVDSLFTNGLILSKAIVDSAGNIVQSDPVTSTAIMDRNKFVYLRDVAKVNRSKINFGFETSRDINHNQQFVKIYDYEGLGIKMGVKVKGKNKIKTKSK